jgi:hypothetical protein|nr:MAG TPA: hypothetical protein [Bacteriophage sp.]
MKTDTIIQRIRNTGLPYTEIEFQGTIETPFPQLPYIVYIKPLIEEDKSDDGAVYIRRVKMAIELYTDRTPEEVLEKKIEEEVLKDIEYKKYQTKIENEDITQTAYEFSIIEKGKING